jgi:hypothetical protein
MTTYTYDELSEMGLEESEQHVNNIMNEYEDYCSNIEFFIEQRKFNKEI